MKEQNHLSLHQSFLTRNFIMSISIFLLVLVVQSVPLVQCAYKISDFKFKLFERDRLEFFRVFESRNLDENSFQSDYTKAPRHFNTSKCIDDLLSIERNLRIGDKESMMRKIGSDFASFICSIVPFHILFKDNFPSSKISARRLGWCTVRYFVSEFVWFRCLRRMFEYSNQNWKWKRCRRN